MPKIDKYMRVLRLLSLHSAQPTVHIYIKPSAGLFKHEYSQFPSGNMQPALAATKAYCQVAIAPGWGEAVVYRSICLTPPCND